MELLSPAGSYESMVAAVQNGADAVYMGGTMFNARRNAKLRRFRTGTRHRLLPYQERARICYDEYAAV